MKNSIELSHSEISYCVPSMKAKQQEPEQQPRQNKTKQNKKFKYEAHFLLDSTSAEREDVLENSKSHVMTNGLDLRQMTVTMTTTMTMTTTTTTMTLRVGLG